MTGVQLTSAAEFALPGWIAQVNLSNWLDAAYERLPTAMILWGGLAILSIALIVLMRTRWAQSRPVACCVALSIFAHILLFSYAYGTRLMLAVPVSEAVEPIPVQLVDDPQPLEPDPDTVAETSAAPWDELVGEEGLQPATSAPPAISETETSVPTERTAVTPLNVEPSPHDLTARTQPVEPDRPPREAVTPLPFERVSIAADSTAALARPTLHSQHEPLAPIDSPAVTVDSSSARLPQPTLPPAPQVGQSAGDLTFDPTIQRLAESLLDEEAREFLAGPDHLTPSRIVRATGLYEPPRDDATPHSSDIPVPVKPASIANRSAPQGNELIEQLIAQPRTRLGDGRAIPEPFRLRRADHRLDIALARGGTAETEAAVQAGLKWLASVQRRDGGWDADRYGGGQETGVLGHERGGAGAEADTGITGLAILAFLSAGYTHQEGDYREVVSSGLNYLIAQQGTDGNLHGQARLFARMYCHGMALFALSEAYGMTGDHALRDAVQAGLTYTVDAQHPAGGGWRYQPQDEGDMSQFGWQVMAIKSAALAGVIAPRRTHADLHRFLDSCCRGNFGGLASYRPQEQISPTMTAEALVCRLLLENTPQIELIREAQGAIAQGTQTSGLRLTTTSARDSSASTPTVDQPNDRTTVPDSRLNLYFLYYGTLAMFLAQDDAWKTWNQHLQNELLPAQVQVGREVGSWSPDTVWGGYGGRVYSTAMATLCLEVYYRYLPLYQVSPDDEAAAETARNPLRDFRLPR